MDLPGIKGYLLILGINSKFQPNRSITQTFPFDAYSSIFTYIIIYAQFLSLCRFVKAKQCWYRLGVSTAILNIFRTPTNLTRNDFQRRISTWSTQWRICLLGKDLGIVLASAFLSWNLNLAILKSQYGTEHYFCMVKILILFNLKDDLLKILWNM